MTATVTPRPVFCVVEGAYRDRAEFAADPAFFPVPVERLISKDYGRELAATVNPVRATTSASLPGPVSGESDDTTHFSVVDNSGNMVANTYTLNGFYGSQVIPRGTGVLMNDIMSGFTDRADDRNRIGPGKRPVSSMTPSIVLYPDGKPWVALGSPGSATIPNTVLQTIVNLIDYLLDVCEVCDLGVSGFVKSIGRWLTDRGAIPVETIARRVKRLSVKTFMDPWTLNV